MLALRLVGRASADEIREEAGIIARNVFLTSIIISRFHWKQSEKQNKVYCRFAQMSVVDVLSATGKSIPCGKASSSKTRLDSFPRLSKYERDDGPRMIRKRRYKEASREFRKAFETALSELYEPAIQDLTEYFVALDRSKRRRTGVPSTYMWVPGTEAGLLDASGFQLSPARIHTGLLLHSTAQSPVFYDELDRSFSRNSLCVVRFSGQECTTFKTTMQTLAKRIIAKIATADERLSDDMPETLVELKEYLDRQPSMGILLLHFPVLEDFPARLLSDIILALAQSQLPIAFLMGITSLDAYEQALRSMETQGSLEVSRFAITSGGPDEVFGRIMSQIFLNPIKPPPVYLDYRTYDFLHNQFFEGDNSIESLFDAIDLAVLHHFHTVPTSAFCNPPIPVEQTDTAPVSERGWLTEFVKDVRKEALSPFFDFAEEDADEEESPRLRPGQLKFVPHPILVSGINFEDHREAHTLKMKKDDAYFLSQLPSFRSGVDMHMAWLARAIAVLCCVQRFLQEKDIREPAAWGKSNALAFARHATYAMAAGSQQNFFGRALEGNLVPTFSKLEKRILELDAKQCASLMELVALVLDQHYVELAKLSEGPPDEFEGQEANDRGQQDYKRNPQDAQKDQELQQQQQEEGKDAVDEGPPRQTKNGSEEDLRQGQEEHGDGKEDEEREEDEDQVNGDRSSDDEFGPSNDQEEAEVLDLHAKLQSFIEILEDWRADESTAREEAARDKKEAEDKAQAELERCVSAVGRDEAEERLPDGVTEDGKVITSIHGPLLFRQERMTKEKAEQAYKAKLDRMEVDEKERQIKSDQVFEGIRRDFSKAIRAFWSSRCQPLPTALRDGEAPIPLSRIWQCQAATFLSTHLEPTPRHTIISQLDDPFPIMERYGMSHLISGSQKGRVGANRNRFDEADELGPATDMVRFVTDFDELKRSGALPDVCRAYQLYRDSPRFLNFADWFDAFAQGVRADSAVLAVTEKAAGSRGRQEIGDDDLPDATELRNSRPKRKRKDDDATPTDGRHKQARNGQVGTSKSAASGSREGRDDPLADSKQHDDTKHIQARFALAVNELAIMGFIKGTRRKVEHTMKVIFDLPGGV
ncbi:hypothetical protein A4X13_0g5303 [Tilletia indica]|uniref:Uncharacterized protein n=1 Tax=Tilletia indica TaxID=43049 RepID=A0A177TJL7_9BASI|nr:hypothetical protein A4X13_0g5303 [Tilletia indica]